MLRIKILASPAPPAIVVWPVTDGLWQGYLGANADWPYLLTGLLGQRSESQRGWTASDSPLVPVGTLYGTIEAFGTPHHCDVSPGSTLAAAIDDFPSSSGSLQRTPTDVILARGLVDIENGDTAASVLAKTQLYWGMVRTAFPSARLWQIVTWIHPGASAEQISYLDGLAAGQAGPDVSLIDWRDAPYTGLFTQDPAQDLQNLPATPTDWAVWLGAQLYQNNLSWCARGVLEALYGTHVGGTWCLPRTLLSISGDEAYP